MLRLGLVSIVLVDHNLYPSPTTHRKRRVEYRPAADGERPGGSGGSTLRKISMLGWRGPQVAVPVPQAGFPGYSKLKGPRVHASASTIGRPFPEVADHVEVAVAVGSNAVTGEVRSQPSVTRSSAGKASWVFAIPDRRTGRRPVHRARQIPARLRSAAPCQPIWR